MISFGISIAAGALIFVTFIIAGVLNQGRIEHGHTYPGQTIVGLAIIGLLAVDALAAGLGIAAVCQSGTKRIFGILGLIFSSVTIIGTVGLIVLGLLYASRFAR